MKDINLFRFLERFKKLNLFLILFYCIACNNEQERIQNLEAQNDSLKKEVDVLLQANRQLLQEELKNMRAPSSWMNFHYFDTLQTLNELMSSTEESKKQQFINYFLSYPYDTLALAQQKVPISLKDSTFQLLTNSYISPFVYFPPIIAWYAARISPITPEAYLLYSDVNPQMQYIPNSQNPRQQTTHFLIYQFDRSPENIQELFDAYETTLYQTMDKALYEQLQVGLVIEDLLFSYDYLKENDYQQIFNYLDTHPRKRHFYWYDNPKPSTKEVEEGYLTSPSKKDHVYKVQWRYSFWYRRYLEGNMEVVHQILLKVKEHYDK